MVKFRPVKAAMRVRFSLDTHEFIEYIFYLNCEINLFIALFKWIKNKRNSKKEQVGQPY